MNANSIVERLRDAALFYRSKRPSVNHEKRIPRTQEITERECDEIAEREEAAIAEIERLQKELGEARRIISRVAVILDHEDPWDREDVAAWEEIAKAIRSIDGGGK
ncbi:hypothetical protein [Hyphomicrobium sp. DY-1]|uniref:hypothetical protein n=1 Tax=Hyphomicrobium sp. DY-1 TaxID=3075650 RepID=UPI0039C3EA4F